MKLLMVPPTGETRISYLYPAEGAASDVKEYLRERFGRNCVILDSERALRAGLFGRGRAKEGIESRIGSLMALPKPGFGLKYFFREREEEDVGKLPRGAHGGLTEDEQLVPLLVGTVDEFKGR